MIEKASPKDIPDLVELILKFPLSTPLDFPKPSPTKIAKTLQACLDSGVIFMATRARPRGVLALREGEFWFAHSRFLGDQIYFVEPGARASNFAKHLLRHAQDYATLRGLPLLMGVTHGGDVVRKDNFFTRAGMTRIGGIYSRGI